jgi:hypothetical protein
MSAAALEQAQLPEDCPPGDAVPMSGEFFRFTAPKLQPGDIAPADDWVVPYQKQKGECVGCPDRCECHAHSIFRDRGDVERAREISPFARKKSIASLVLSPQMGLVRQSPTDALPSHHDWWPTDPSVAPSAAVVEAAP